MQKNIKKIAVFRALKLGDLLCTTPAFRAIKNSYPSATITLISLPWAKEFVKRYDFFDRFIKFPGYRGLPEQEDDHQKFVEFIQMMEKEEFDLVMQMQGDGTVSNHIVAKFDAKLAAGFYKSGNVRPNRQTFFPYPEKTHEVMRYLQLLKLLGMKVDGENLEFPLFLQDYKMVSKLFDVTKQYAIIHPGGISAGKWSLKNFAEVADYLKDAGYEIVLTGIASERSITEKVASRMKTNPIIFSGKTTLGALGVLVKHSRLLVSNDTGISHLAAALKTPSVIIYTTSDPDIWAPLNKKRHRVIVDKEGHNLSKVLREIDRLLHVSVQSPISKLNNDRFKQNFSFSSR